MTSLAPTVVRPAQAASMLGISPATLWRWASGDGAIGFPRPIKLSPRVTVWRLADLDAWLDGQASGDREVPLRGGDPLSDSPPA